MMDLISRQDVIDAVIKYCMDYDLRDLLAELEVLPSAESEIIRCEDCKWWNQKFDDSPIGYCMAAKHNYYSSHWEIHIQRTYGKNFFCADAEPKEEGEEDGCC